MSSWERTAIACNKKNHTPPAGAVAHTHDRHGRPLHVRACVGRALASLEPRVWRCSETCWERSAGGRNRGDAKALQPRKCSGSSGAQLARASTQRVAAASHAMALRAVACCSDIYQAYR